MRIQFAQRLLLPFSALLLYVRAHLPAMSPMVSPMDNGPRYYGDSAEPFRVATPPPVPYFDCGSVPSLSRKQLEICKRNKFAMRVIQKGVQEAVRECRVQFANEKWNCTARRGLGAHPLKGLAFDDSTNPDISVASRENAYVYALSAGAISHSVARACAQGQIPDCNCAEMPREGGKDYIWAGCSDNLKYGNWFSRRFVDTAEKEREKHGDLRAKMNLHNNRVGRKVLAANMKKQCKCHGVSGSCVTKTCWKVVPEMDEFAALLKQKYDRALQVTLPNDSESLHVVRGPSQGRTGRTVSTDPLSSTVEYKINVPIGPKERDILVYIDDSPNYCNFNATMEIRGTRGRECHTVEQCNDLCCGRGWTTRDEWREEPCRCRFEWCCEVKCETCVRQITRRHCN